MRLQCFLWTCRFLLMVSTSQSKAASEEQFLDVSIQTFSHAEAPAVKTSKTEPFSKKADPVQAVLASETRLLPMYLRYRLEKSGSFGAVRVLPSLDAGSELKITGQIIKSDGFVLELAIKAVDSTGRIWLDRVFNGTAVSSQTLSADSLAEDDFSQMFGQITTQLKQRATQLNAQQLGMIKSVALLRYGLGLVPAAFATYLDESATGEVNLKRMPATDDPLLKRILDVREKEYQFIDVVDEEYSRFYDAVKPLYDTWRTGERSLISETREASKERGSTKTNGYTSVADSPLELIFNNYAESMQREEWQELGLKEGFTNEIEPTELQTNDALHRLTGTFEQQYREWRGILAELFALDAK